MLDKREIAYLIFFVACILAAVILARYLPAGF